MAAKKKRRAKGESQAKRSAKPKAKTAARRSAPRAAKVKPIPDGYPHLCPVLVLDDCGKAIDWYKKLLGAKEKMRMPMHDGKVAHAELKFGDAVLMLADPMPGMNPVAKGKFCLYAKDCDALFDAAVKGGATAKMPPQNMFYGDRTAQIVDPFGNEWTLMTHVEDVSAKEMMKRMAALPKS